MASSTPLSLGAIFILDIRAGQWVFAWFGDEFAAAVGCIRVPLLQDLRDPAGPGPRDRVALQGFFHRQAGFRPLRF